MAVHFAVLIVVSIGEHSVSGFQVAVVALVTVSAIAVAAENVVEMVLLS